MSDDINYHFPDFRLADQSKNVFAKHDVDLANKCLIEKLSVLYYNRDKERVDRI